MSRGGKAYGVSPSETKKSQEKLREVYGDAINHLISSHYMEEIWFEVCSRINALSTMITAAHNFVDKSPEYRNLFRSREALIDIERSVVSIHAKAHNIAYKLFMTNHPSKDNQDCFKSEIVSRVRYTLGLSEKDEVPRDNSQIEEGIKEIRKAIGTKL